MMPRSSIRRSLCIWALLVAAASAQEPADTHPLSVAGTAIEHQKVAIERIAERIEESGNELGALAAEVDKLPTARRKDRARVDQLKDRIGKVEAKLKDAQRELRQTGKNSESLAKAVDHALIQAKDEDGPLSGAAGPLAWLGMGIAFCLIQLLVLLSYFRLRGRRLPPPQGARIVVEARAEPPTTPTSDNPSPGPAPAAAEGTKVGFGHYPAGARGSRDDASGVAELELLPHGKIGRLLIQLHQAVPNLERRLGDVRRAERFLRDLGTPLAARIERFKEAVLRGEEYLNKNWLDQDLVTTLNTLSELLSVVIEERHRGGRVGRAVEEEIQWWLYEKLAAACRDEGFFEIEEILPFTTRFDAKCHRAVESKPIAGAGDLVVGIKSIGRRETRTKVLTHKAEVVVGG